MNFSENIKFLRKQKGINQGELGKLLSVGRTAIAGYEIGKSKPTFDTLTKIASLFGVSLDDLVYKKIEKSNKMTYPGYKETPVVNDSQTSYQSTAEKEGILIRSTNFKNYINTVRERKNVNYGELIRLPFVDYATRDFEVDDNNLSPYLVKGDFVVTKKLENFKQINLGKIYVIVTEDKGIRCHFLEIIGEEVELKSLNETIYRPYKLPISAILEVWECCYKITPHLISLGNYSEQTLMDTKNSLKRLEKRLDKIEHEK